jgi:hypothetical protein
VGVAVVKRVASGQHVGVRHRTSADPLRLGVFLVHASIVGYVVSGWTSDEAYALLGYVVLLPLIVLQWLLNRGASVVSNIENLMRSGRWRDPDEGLEGAFFSLVLKSVGIPATRAQINTAVVSVMFLLWTVALLRMVEIVGQ